MCFICLCFISRIHSLKVDGKFISLKLMKSLYMEVKICISYLTLKILYCMAGGFGQWRQDHRKGDFLKMSSQTKLNPNFQIM